MCAHDHVLDAYTDLDTRTSEQVERQGVLCKEWQRTPMQLLHEYCQSKKRRNAFYPTVKAPEGRFRYVRICVLFVSAMC